MELLLAAKLTTTELFEVLKGSWASYIVEMDAGKWLSGILTEEQIAWLSDEAALGRYKIGRTVVRAPNHPAE